MTPTIRGIQIVVSARCGVSLNDLLSDRRAYSRQRQIGMWIARHMTRASYPQIARQFGLRDHTTVMHGISRIDQEMAKDWEFHGLVLAIWKTCRGEDARPYIPFGFPQVPHSPHPPQTTVEASESGSHGVGIKPPALGGGAIRSFTEWGASGDPLLRERESLCQSQRAL